MQGFVIGALATLICVAAPDQARHAADRQRDAAASRQQADALVAQVMLDRAGFSPGVIDGAMGDRTRRALEAYHAAGHQSRPVNATTIYTITAEDAAGPFEPVPADLMEQASLQTLGYGSIVEKLAERFHSTPALLRRLNPDSTFQPGDGIAVPDVQPMMVPAPRRQQPLRNAQASVDGTPRGEQVRVTVSKAESALRIIDSNGTLIFYAPVTTGSEHDPLPLGTWTVTGVQYSPKFHYNPDLFLDADPDHSKATIQPGPNNPVGVVWIDITKEHYGLHGTPDPETVGNAQSHGCVRLTNWDALKVASLVKPGTPVLFTE